MTTAPFLEDTDRPVMYAIHSGIYSQAAHSNYVAVMQRMGKNSAIHI